MPYQVDVPTQKHAVANWIIIGLTVWLFSIIRLPSASVLTPGSEASSPWVLGTSSEAWVGYMFAHLDVVHLVGNMLFLWLFGNAICAKIGNIAYPLVYVGCGLAAAATHMLFDGKPAVGASGAINGIVGMFVIWYPLNTVSCLLMVQLHPTWFSMSSVWLILVWLVFDIVGARFGLGGVAYYAHLGGFFCGAAVGAVLLLSGAVKMESWEKSLLQALRLSVNAGDCD